ncbi:MAG: phosphoribosylglycinamide formyltransferase [Ruminococcaceae bacterium]|nr:phosphoribosylglycinamide formyltransferase [Oscillospiraceae bacterium]
MKVAVLVSGGGTNLQAIIDAKNSGKIRNCELVGVIASNENAYALERAKKASIPGFVVSRKAYDSIEDFNSALADKLTELSAELVVLAGFMSVLTEQLIKKFPKIINVHPALIPSFCGKGFYGLHVHEAALKYGVKVTGATVHYVNEVVDGGEIILQKAVDVLENDTPEILQKRVMEQAEWIILPKAVDMICNG